MKDRFVYRFVQTTVAINTQSLNAEAIKSSCLSRQTTGYTIGTEIAKTFLSPDVSSFSQSSQNTRSYLLIELNYAPSRKDLRLFAIILIPFSFFAGWLIRRQFDPNSIGWSVNFVLVIAGVAGSIWPAAVKQIFLVWTVITFPIGWVISHLVLALIFFGVFYPIGLVMKCFGYDPLQLLEKDCDSYWVKLEPMTDQERYFRQF